jgi:hypothetical protein
MLRYILGYSPAERVLRKLSLRANALLGRGLAIAAAVGWGIFLCIVFRSVGGVMARPGAARGQPMASWLVDVMFVFILVPGFYGRMVAERDLSARVDTLTGMGRRWRWALIVLYWGIWAYWLFGARRLPSAVAALGPDSRVADGPSRGAAV